MNKLWSKYSSELPIDTAIVVNRKKLGTNGKLQTLDGDGVEIVKTYRHGADQPIHYITASTANQFIDGNFLTPPKARVFLCIGQSNMAGSGAPVTHLPLTYLENSNNVLADRYSPNSPAGFFTEFRSLSAFSPGTTFGPEISFAEKLNRSYPNDIIVILHSSQPGTGMSFWTNEGQTGRTVTLDRITLAEEWLQALVDNNTIGSYEYSGILAVNGENEANGDYPDSWESTFPNMINLYRTRLGNPNLPVVYLKLFASYTSPPAGNVDVVRSAQQAWSDADDFGQVVDSDGFKLIDPWHYGAISMWEMGNRFSDAWFRELKNELTPVIYPTEEQAGLTVKNLCSMISDNVLTYDVVFNNPITSFSVDNLSLQTTTGGTVTGIVTVVPNLHYRVTVGNFQNVGTISLDVPARSVVATDGKKNVAATRRNCFVVYAPHAGLPDLRLYEGFTSVIQPLHGLRGGFGQRLGGWRHQNDTDTYTTHVPTSPLSYESLLSSPHCAMGATGFGPATCFLDLEHAFSDVTTSKSGSNVGVNASGYTMWFSCLVRPVNITLNHYISLSNGATNAFVLNENVFQIKRLSSNNHWYAGIRATPDGSLTDTGIALVANQTYLMVWKLTFGGTGTSSVHYWIDPAHTLGGTAPDDATANGVLTVANDSNFRVTSIKWRCGSGTNPDTGMIGDIRIGDTWASVTPST